LIQLVPTKIQSNLDEPTTTKIWPNSATTKILVYLTKLVPTKIWQNMIQLTSTKICPSQP